MIKVDPKIDDGKWCELKKTGCFGKPADADSLIPQNGWQVFPSRNIPSMFNYGLVYYYLLESIENDSDNDEHDAEESVVMTGDTVTAKPCWKVVLSKIYKIICLPKGIMFYVHMFTTP